MISSPLCCRLSSMNVKRSPLLATQRPVSDSEGPVRPQPAMDKASNSNVGNRIVNSSSLLADGNRKPIGIEILRHPGAEQIHRLLGADHAVLDHPGVKGIEVVHVKSRPATARRNGVV